MPPITTHHDRSPTFPSSIVIVGAGRLGTALSHSLLQSDLPLTCLWNRRSPIKTEESLPYVIGELPRKALQQADLVLLTVSDHAIASLAATLAQSDLTKPKQVILHCSGLLNKDALLPLQSKGCEIGSMHPLQPITSQSTLSNLFAGIAVGIEGSPIAQKTATWLAQRLGGNTFSLEGVDKRLYHAAAVFASNYVVSLAHVAVRLQQEAGLTDDPLQLLLPLLQQAVQNVQTTGLPGALTGPISRGDATTLQQHLEALQQHVPEISDLYIALAQATLPIAQAQHDQKGTPEKLDDLTNLLNKQRDNS